MGLASLLVLPHFFINLAEMESIDAFSPAKQTKSETQSSGSVHAGLSNPTTVILSTKVHLLDVCALMALISIMSTYYQMQIVVFLHVVLSTILIKMGFVYPVLKIA